MLATVHTRLLLLGAAVGLCACSTVGNGVPVTETREVGEFEEIDVGGIFDVVVHVGAPTRVEVKGDQNIVPLVVTKISGGRLEIGTTKSIAPNVDLVIDIGTPALRELDLSGAGSAAVSGLDGGEFELDLSGAGKVVLAGRVEQLDAEVSGAGDLDAAALDAGIVRIDLSGAGDADVTARELLDAEVSGAGSIRYGGQPKDVKKDVSGVGSIEPR
jgi:hypothetical protein